MRLGVQGTSGEGLNGEFFGFLGAGIRFVELPRDQVTTGDPGKRFQILGRDAALRFVALNHRFGQREIAL